MSEILRECQDEYLQLPMQLDYRAILAVVLRDDPVQVTSLDKNFKR